MDNINKDKIGVSSGGIPKVSHRREFVHYKYRKIHLSNCNTKINDKQKQETTQQLHYKDQQYLKARNSTIITIERSTTNKNKKHHQNNNTKTNDKQKNARDSLTDKNMCAPKTMGDDLAAAQVLYSEPQVAVALVRLEECGVGELSQERPAGHGVNEVGPVTLPL